MEYWIIVDGRHAGPYSAAQLVAAGMTPDTLVWREGLSEWVPASQVEELARLIAERDGTTAAGTPEEPAETVVTETETTIISEPEPAPCEPAAQQTPPGYAHPAPGIAYGAPSIGRQPEEPCPPTYVGWSVAATILCCIPLGIPAIIFSAMVKSAYYRGEIAKARRYSNLAQWFIILAITLGVVCWPFQLALTL